MLKNLITCLLVIASTNAFGQKASTDSTIQLVLQWNIGDVQHYTVSTGKYRLHEIDTISKEKTTHDVAVTVLDKADGFYTIQWITNNILTNSTNPTIQKLIHLAKVKKVVFKTDEAGKFLELVNWEELQDHMEQLKHSLQTDFKDAPELALIKKQIEDAFVTKETFQASITKEVIQFLHFHGRAYTPGEIKTEHPKVANILGSDLLDSDLRIVLDDSADDEDVLSFRSTQEVNSEQLTTSNYNYMKTIAKNMGMSAPKRKDIPPMRNYTAISSLIYRSGWVSSSIQTSILVADGISNVENRIIRIQ